MKKYLASLSMFMILTTNAATIEEAKDLFEKRGENASNAELAANLFNSLAKSASSPKEKAILKTKEAQALYYFGGFQPNDSKKKEVYNKGVEAAKDAFSILDTNKDATKTEKAEAHYFFAINLGKWAEANGVLASLSRWPELKEQLDIIDSLDKSVEDYGSLRTRARALHKLPFGDKSEAEKILETAATNTMNETFGIGNNTTANLYYLDILAKNRKTEKFCEVFAGMEELSKASDEELKEFNPHKLPETKNDIKNFIDNKGFEEDVKKFADRNC